MGVDFNERSGKIVGREGEKERTNVDNIYAVGDILEGVPELMPVAARAGKFLAHRLAARKAGDESAEMVERLSMDYEMIPTTVFSPTEYSFVGLSEAEAI